MTRFRPTLTRLDDRIAPTVLPTGFAESVLTGGLTAPTGMVVAPDGRLFITEQGGSLRVVKDGVLLPTPFATLPTDANGERGLLGVALDPNFADNQHVYVYYTVPASPFNAPFNRVSRFTATGDVAVPGSETVLLNLEPLTTATNHNGGAIRFGPDGKLYVAVGDNANGFNSQSLLNRKGKVLRFNPDGTIPDDNPTALAGVFGVPQGVNRAIWAVGLRNPFSFAFQPGTGRMLVHDVGSTRFEEINEGGAGRNYGWPATEGDFDQSSFPNFTRPIYAYGRGDDPLFAGTAITGGVFYNPSELTFPAEFAGDYFFTDLSGGWIDRIDLDGGRVTNFASDLTGKLPVALAVEADGDLLYLARGFTAGQGAVYRIANTRQGQPIVAAGLGAGAGGASVAVFSPTSGSPITRFPAFDPAFVGGTRVATADVTGDGTPDIVTGAGPGGGPHVKVFDGVTFAEVRTLFAFEASFTGGVYVAAADFNRDGFAEVIVSADVGGGPRIRVFDGKTSATIADFFALETSFRGGVRVSAGDVNADSVPDLVMAAGFGGGPRVAVFEGHSVATGAPARLGADFFAFEETLRNGAFVSAGDFDRDGFADLITGAGPGGGPRVTVFSGKEFLAGRQTQLSNFFAGDPSLRLGVAVGATDADGSGIPEVLAAPAGGNGLVTAHRYIDGAVLRTYEAFPGFTGAVFVG